MKIQEIILNIAESLEKELAEKTKLKVVEGLEDKIIKGNTESAETIDIIAHVVDGINNAKIEWPTIYEEDSHSVSDRV